jgi:hypothetical protein
MTTRSADPGKAFGEPSAGNQSRQRRRPQPVARLVAGPASLTARDSVLVPERQDLCVWIAGDASDQPLRCHRRGRAAEAVGHRSGNGAAPAAAGLVGRGPQPWEAGPFPGCSPRSAARSRVGDQGGRVPLGQFLLPARAGPRLLADVLGQPFGGPGGVVGAEGVPGGWDCVGVYVGKGQACPVEERGLREAFVAVEHEDRCLQGRV